LIRRLRGAAFRPRAAHSSMRILPSRATGNDIFRKPLQRRHTGSAFASAKTADRMRSNI